jgi:hypothetical protein
MLSADLLGAKRLVVELREREHEANLAAEAADLGIWTRDTPATSSGRATSGASCSASRVTSR